MMTGAMVAFGCAVAGTSMICYALMTRAERMKRNRRSGGDTSSDGGSSSGSEGWAVASWFGGHNATDSSGNPVDFGGGDSGGGDGGGGDGGGGGGD
jgi:hypothetical protein